MGRWIGGLREEIGGLRVAVEGTKKEVVDMKETIDDIRAEVIIERWNSMQEKEGVKRRNLLR